MGIFKEIKKGLYSYQEADHGWIVKVDSAENLLEAAAKVRDAGVKNFDCFTPYPIHGLDTAMGLHRSWITFFSLIAGLFGAAYAFLGMTYIDVVSWPQVFGGKPYFSWLAYIPITFELMVLFSSFATIGAVFWLGKLGKIDRKPPLPEVTSHSFAVWIGDAISKQDVEKIFGSLSSGVFDAKEANP